MYKEYYSANWLWVVGSGWFCNLYCTLPPTTTPLSYSPSPLPFSSPFPLCPGSNKSPPAVVHFLQAGVLLSSLFRTS